MNRINYKLLLSRIKGKTVIRPNASPPVPPLPAQ